jgi:ubiquinone/menaquinone biosynthesis C-methylase UbiE
MSKRDSFHDYSDADSTEDAQEYINYLDTATANTSYKRQTYGLLQAQPGNRLLDVGFGAGADLRALAEIVGADGSVVGVDSSEAIVTETKKRLSAEGLPVEVHVGDAHSLQFPDSTFDGCRSDRVFSHLSDRVCSVSGGRAFLVKT